LARPQHAHFVAKMVATNTRVVDKRMLSKILRRRPSYNLMAEMETLYKSDWMREANKDKSRKVENFFKDRTAAKFFENLIHRHKIKDRHNLLGGVYEELDHRYDQGKLLGTGAFGKVYEVTDKATGQKFACKEMDKVHLFQEGYQDMARTEIAILKTLTAAGCDCVMGIRESFEDSRHLFMVLELCEGGDVYGSVAKHFKESGSYSEADAAALMRSMLRAVQQCHANGILHRDIKPDNFLWTDPGGKGELKLADFGLATFWRTEDDTARLNERCGTPPFMPPEMWDGKYYTTEPDVWSLGVTMSILLSGKYPFKFSNAKECADATRNAVVNYNKLPWMMVSLDARNLLSRMLEKNPAKRITISEALQHPWVREGGTAPFNSIEDNMYHGVRAMMNMNQLHKISLRLLAKEGMREAEASTIRTVFETIDSDGDGGITLSDFRPVILRLDKTLTEDDVVTLLGTLDSDGDGVITFDDWVLSSMHLRAQADESRMAEAFHLLDRNKDGYITREDMKEARHRPACMF